MTKTLTVLKQFSGKQIADAVMLEQEVVLARGGIYTLVAVKNGTTRGFTSKVINDHTKQSYSLVGYNSRDKKPSVQGLVVIAEKYINQFLNGKELVAPVERYEYALCDKTGVLQTSQGTTLSEALLGFRVPLKVVEEFSGVAVVADNMGRHYGVKWSKI